MDGGRKSDRLVVPVKPSNKASDASLAAEEVEGRGLAKGNPLGQTRSRTQSRVGLRQALQRIRQAAKEKEERLTALFHHVYEVDRLREAYYGVNRKGSPGVDHVTWQQYGESLESNLEELSQRLRRGAYRAKPVQRGYVPKDDGRRRPIGMPTLEDKIVQRSFAEVVGAVYEAEFLGFSYGFRPGRSAHHALDALAVGLEKRRVRWVLDADIRGYFDAISHEWLCRFIEHRIGDRRVVRHVKKWLRAGVMEEGKHQATEAGTPQGGSVSPLLANIYLHHVFDQWAHQWRRRHAQGAVIIVRYADDFVVGFEHQGDAERFLEELRERLRQFELELSAEKTRLIEFGRYAAENRRERGLGKPETFDFLGFTHLCAKDRKGRFAVHRKTMKRRLRAKVKEVKAKLRRRLHDDPQEVGKWLGWVLRGHYGYYAVPFNIRALSSFRDLVARQWLRTLRRRSQKGRRFSSRRFQRLATRWLPRPRILHPYPSQRLCVTT